MKTCCKCKEPKPLEEFSPRRESKDGRTSWCKLCMSKYMREKRTKQKAKLEAMLKELRRLKEQ